MRTGTVESWENEVHRVLKSEEEEILLLFKGNLSEALTEEYLAQAYSKSSRSLTLWIRRMHRDGLLEKNSSVRVFWALTEYGIWRRSSLLPRRKDRVTIRSEIFEELWRVADMARFIVCPPRGNEDEDFSVSMADCLKMLDRSVSVFSEGEKSLRGLEATKHPWVQELEKKDQEILRASLKELQTK